jgi:hypothetical protein
MAERELIKQYGKLCSTSTRVDTRKLKEERAKPYLSTISVNRLRPGL